MPFSIYQIPVRRGFLQAEFHPRDSALFVLYEEGCLESIALSGDSAGSFSFPHKPVSFCIVPDGSLAYILCEGILITYNLITKRHTASKIDEVFSFLECHKNCAVLYGLQKQVLILKPHGRKLCAFHLEAYIRQLKTVPDIRKLLVYNENRHMLCLDMNGTTLWSVEQLYISSDILISRDGRNGYFFDYSDNLVKFNLQDQSFVALSGIPPCKFIAMPADGSLLLVFDLRNDIRLYDARETNIWNYHLAHPIHKIRMAPQGDYFAALDEDGILTCFSVQTPEQHPDRFLEPANNKRVLDRPISWSVHSSAALLQMELNPAGSHVGVVNRNNRILFFDEQGAERFQTAFPDPVKSLASDDPLTCCFIRGAAHARLMHIPQNRSVHYHFNAWEPHTAVVNFDHQRIFFWTKNARFWIYDFNGEPVGERSSPQKTAWILSCEKYGTALVHGRLLTLLSPRGEPLFEHGFKTNIRQLFYARCRLLGSLSDQTLFSFELETRHGRYCRFENTANQASIVSAEPFLYADGNGSLLHLSPDLEKLGIFKIRSSTSLFFLNDGEFQEIVRMRETFFGHDKDQKRSWRYHAKEPFVASALMKKGMVFITRNSIGYIRLTEDGESEDRISGYLEF